MGSCIIHPIILGVSGQSQCDGPAAEAYTLLTHWPGWPVLLVWREAQASGVLKLPRVILMSNIWTPMILISEVCHLNHV